MENIVVSIACCCYNHESYISRALDGFIMQKTNFAFEVIIHDDASNDRSADIILDYAKKYPDIIKPIIQTQNQYSKGIKIYSTYIYPNCNGKYIAFCEGDDYWTDDNKLQTQIDYLEKHNEYIACTHNSLFSYVKSSEPRIKYGIEDKDIILKDVIYSGGQSFHTSSIIVKKDYVINAPQWVNLIKGVGDYPSSIYYVLSGKVRYFGNVMSVYNVGTANSWTEQMNKNKSARAKVYEDTIIMLTEANKYYNYKYNEIFQKVITEKEYENLLFMEKYNELKKPQYIGIYKKQPLSERIKIMIKQYMPLFCMLYRKARRKS